MSTVLTKKIIREEIIGETTKSMPIVEALVSIENLIGKDGHIMAMPEFLSNRIDSSFDDLIWTIFTTLSEEDHGLDKEDNKIYVVAHGNGILKNSERIKEAIAEGTLDYGFTRFKVDELSKLLNGDNVFGLEEIKNKNLTFPLNYAIVGKVSNMNVHTRGAISLDDLRTDDVFLMRCGSEELRHRYLDKISERWGSYGNWHRLHGVNHEIPQGRLLYAGSDYNIGLNGPDNLSNYARFVGVRGAEGAKQKI